MLNRLTQSLEFQTQALTLRADRQRLIASNIANADTPGYVARDFDFAQALRQALGTGGGFRLRENAEAARTPGGGGTVGRQPRLNYSAAGQPNLDGNSVDMDRERAAAADNAVRYEATLRFANSSIRTALDAMKSHHQA